MGIFYFIYEEVDTYDLWICSYFIAEAETLRDGWNIKGAYPEAVVIQEVFTGTNYKDQAIREGIVRRVKADDTIVFDSVFR